MKRAHLCLILFLLLPMHSASAFRCEQKLVSPGDTKYEVLSRCGEPTWTEKRTVKRIEPLYDGSHLDRQHHGRSETVVIPVEIEEWTYNLGPGRLIQILTFENGKLVKIENGGYGY